MADEQGRPGRAIGRSSSRSAETHTTLCHAPSMNLYLFANGDVGPCCRNRSFGNVRTAGLGDLWSSTNRSEMVAQLADGAFPASCDLCEAEHRLEGRNRSFSATFDAWRAEFDAEDAGDSAGQVGTAADGPSAPERIEFELSNTCNLQCVQCNGELSSTIRSQREHRAPLAPAYGDDFLDDLRPMLPGLRRASFVGGEPFLVGMYDRIWAMIEEDAPDLPCVVVTNGTVWNDRVDRWLRILDIRPFVSIDGITEETYGAIRVGGRLDRVLTNLDRFHDAAAGGANVVFCVMPSNAHEFPDLLLYAEERGIGVTTSIVREPAVHSIGHLAPERLGDLLVGLEERAPELERRLERNLSVWTTELERVRTLHAEASGVNGDRWATSGPRVLMFRRQGTHRVDVERAIDTLRPLAADGVVHTLRVAPGDRARSCSDELAALLGCDRSDIEGQALTVLQPLFRSYDVLATTPDRYEVHLELERGPARMIMVPARNHTGWADDVVVAFAFGYETP